MQDKETKDDKDLEKKLRDNGLLVKLSCGYNLDGTWTHADKCTCRKDFLRKLEQNRFEKLEETFKETHLGANIEALLSAKEECKHKITTTTEFKTVISNDKYDFQLSEEICSNCGKLLNLYSRKDLEKTYEQLKEIRKYFRQLKTQQIAKAKEDIRDDKNALSC